MIKGKLHESFPCHRKQFKDKDKDVTPEILAQFCKMTSRIVLR